MPLVDEVWTSDHRIVGEQMSVYSRQPGSLWLLVVLPAIRFLNSQSRAANQASGGQGNRRTNCGFEKLEGRASLDCIIAHYVLLRGHR
jgi:hypothetical protein